MKGWKEWLVDWLREKDNRVPADALLELLGGEMLATVDTRDLHLTVRQMHAGWRVPWKKRREREALEICLEARRVYEEFEAVEAAKVEAAKARDRVATDAARRRSFGKMVGEFQARQRWLTFSVECHSGEGGKIEEQIAKHLRENPPDDAYTILEIKEPEDWIEVRSLGSEHPVKQVATVKVLIENKELGVW